VTVQGYDYDRRAAARAVKDPLVEYHLEGLRTGDPVILYHGTTRLFRAFDMSQSRGELNEGYYGNGIFLTPSKRVAELYANANRNIGFPPSIIADLKRKNRPAGNFLQTLFDHGPDGWEIAWKDAGFWNDNPGPGEGKVDWEGFNTFLGVDGNTLQDIADYIIGSKSKPLGSGDGPLDLFGGGSTGTPDYGYGQLDEVGLDSKTYRPKVYTVVATCSNPLVTKSKSAARNARSKGYDSVFFYGADLVQGVPEVAVYSSRNVKVRKIEVV
jgi:hypothetical protein